MLSSLSASDIANEVSMSRSSFGGTYLIVEGATDIRLYGKFASEGVRLVAACSKSNVIGAVSKLVARGDGAVVGIVDRDMDSLLGTRRREPVFVTDRRDMESMLMCSRALDAVLSEYADRGRLEEFEKASGPVRDAVGRAAGMIGALMYISHRRGMNLSFKDIDHSAFVNGRTLAVDAVRMVSSIYAQSMEQMHPARGIADQARDLVRRGDDPWDFARGHDAVAILAIGLRSSFGAYNASRLGKDALGGALRLAFGPEMFGETELFRISSEHAERRGLELWSDRIARRRTAPF